jgi:hypothetical protein
VLSGKIVFLRYGAGVTFDIYAMRANGSARDL